VTDPTLVNGVSDFYGGFVARQRLVYQLKLRNVSVATTRACSAAIEPARQLRHHDARSAASTYDLGTAASPATT
jgi:hypothetical protein